MTTKELTCIYDGIVDKYRTTAKKLRRRFLMPVFSMDDDIKVIDRIFSALILYVFVVQHDPLDLRIEASSVINDVRHRRAGKWPGNRPDCLFVLWVEKPLGKRQSIDSYIEENAFYDYQLELVP